MAESPCISWLPAWVAPSDLVELEVASPHPGERWSCLQPRADAWPRIGDGLRAAQAALRALPVAQIATAIDHAARLWLQPSYGPRRRAQAEIARATGFSPAAVGRSFELELRNYRGPELWRALRRELGDPRQLDEFRPVLQLGGHTRALGPSIVLAIFTGNVPGLPALSLVRALLVKSAVIAKVASGEPLFAAAFARTLAEVEPRLGAALLVTYWERDDDATLRAARAEVDALIVYGGSEACAAIRAQVGSAARYVEHGHRFSAAVLSRAYLRERGAAEVARRVAADVSAFNQHACIAPQACLLEATPAEARCFGELLAEALEREARTCPLGTLGDSAAAALQLRRSSAAWDAARDPECELWCAPGLDWTVILTRALEAEGGGDRVLRLLALPSLEHALAQLAPLGAALQNVGLGAHGDELWRSASELARLGASRVCEPGRMAQPSLAWRHDGEPCLARLLRWCDIEMHEGAPLPATARRSARRRGSEVPA